MSGRRRESVTPTRQLSEFSIDEILSFSSAWSPPKSWEPWRAAERWQSWDAYLTDWAAVRDEWLSTGLGPQPPFADRVVRYLARYGAEALAHARFEDIKYSE
jgi:hypothetical protein